MGVVENISFLKFPKQGDLVGRRVSVCYHFDASQTHEGTCVRDDREEPFVAIFKLDNGRHVIATECQYMILSP